jgi:hypothetical protein
MLVALLALFVALGGTGYAALSLPANSVGAKQLKKKAVTGKKIRKNAVTSPKVKDFSLVAKDFKAGAIPAGAKGDQGPPGPTFAATAMGGVEAPVDPPADPEGSSADARSYGRHFDFTLPAGGRVYVRFFMAYWGVGCSAGEAHAGLYLDGAPVPGSGHTLSGMVSPDPQEFVATVAAGAGPHSVEVRHDCPSGDVTGWYQHPVPTWTVVLLGG